MRVIFQRSGWDISAVERGYSKKYKNIYLVYMPLDDDNQHRMIERINKQAFLSGNPPDSWSLYFSISEKRPDQL